MKRLALTLLLLMLTSSAWAQTVTTVYSGLKGPRGLEFAPDGALYVAEAGEGDGAAGLGGRMAKRHMLEEPGVLARIDRQARAHQDRRDQLLLDRLAVDLVLDQRAEHA